MSARQGDDAHAGSRATVTDALPGDPPPFECHAPVDDCDVAVLRAYFSRCGAAERSRSERRLSALAPHILQAVRISLSLERLALENAARRQVLDSLRTAVFLLDGQGRVTATNDAAARLADARDGLGISNRFLYSDSRFGDRALQELIRRVLAPGASCPRSLGGIFQLPRPSGRAPYYVRAMALRGAGDRAERTGGGAVVLVADTTRKVGLCQELLMECFRLTPREAAIAVELANGSDVGRCAETLHMNRNTARAHQRQVYRKTGTRRQAELVRLLLDLPLASVRAAAGLTARANQKLRRCR